VSVRVRFAHFASFTLILSMGLSAGAPARAASGGPDAFGYRYVDSNEADGPAFVFVDISPSGTGTGTLVAQGDDCSSVGATFGCSGPFPGPVTLGAPISFYGAIQTDVVPTTNGYISLGGPNDDPGSDFINGCPIPALVGGGSPPMGRIYPLHDDIVVDGPNGGVYFEYFPPGSCPHPEGAVAGGCNVFQWHDARHFGSVDRFDFEALLFDNGDILFQYGPGNPELGGGSTTGIQDYTPAPATALQYESCNIFAHIQDQLAILIFREAPVALDIKPGSCPNPLNTVSRGVLPVAILGAADFDVTQIDLSTIQLEGVPPLRSSLEDVSGPFAPGPGRRVGPTGNLYEAVASASISWDDARLAAAQSTWFGVSGHLATITSPQEDAFLEQLRVQAALREIWVGGFQAAGQATTGDGWSWLNDEGAIPPDNSGPDFANWFLPTGEPNDQDGVENDQENHLTIGFFGQPGWNDELDDGRVNGYVVEHETRCSACSLAGPDGFVDLTLKFDAQAVTAAVGAEEACRVVTISGELLDGTPFAGADSLRVQSRGGGNASSDEDLDAVPDSVDNCLGVANPAQTDANLDGYGNACDADYTNDGVVGAPDFMRLAAAFGARSSDPDYDGVLDANSDGVIGAAEILLFARSLGKAPGPSALSGE
jgi:hypothetical protein